MHGESPTLPGELQRSGDGSVRYGLDEDAWMESPAPASDPAGGADDLLVADVHGRHWRLRRRRGLLERLAAMLGGPAV